MRRRTRGLPFRTTGGHGGPAFIGGDHAVLAQRAVVPEVAGIGWRRVVDRCVVHRADDDAGGVLVCGVGRRGAGGAEGGQIAGGSDSAAHMLAMIKRAARLHEAHGTPVRLKFSDALKAAAFGEVEALGSSFEEFEAQLESSMAAAKP